MPRKRKVSYWFDATGKPLSPCAFCTGKFRGDLCAEDIMPAGRPFCAVSRRDNKTYICVDCGKAEALADRMGITDAMARVAVKNDRQEAFRLPGHVFPASFIIGQPGDHDLHLRWMELREPAGRQLER